VLEKAFGLDAMTSAVFVGASRIDTAATSEPTVSDTTVMVVGSMDSVRARSAMTDRTTCCDDSASAADQLLPESRRVTALIVVVPGLGVGAFVVVDVAKVLTEVVVSGAPVVIVPAGVVAGAALVVPAAEVDGATLVAAVLMTVVGVSVAIGA